MASNTIKFTFKVFVDGKEQIVTTTASAKELRNALSETKTTAEKIGASLLHWNQATAVFANVNSSVSALKSSMEAFTSSYNNSVQAQTKLKTVMGQRMGADAEMVASINSVIAKQTELGVVGGTVQRSGAQQIATFLNEASSLKTLIPAMNDLLTQQRGLNASSEDAVSVANLMGKAMQGQTTALKRVGITFTDAQAEVMKYGTETQRAAMLAEIITDNVGHMNSALAATDAGKVKQAANEFGGLMVKIGSVLSPYQTLINQFAMFGMAASSVLQVGSALLGLARALGITQLAMIGVRTAQASFVAMGTLVNASINGTTLSLTALRAGIKGTIMSLGLIGIAYVALSGIIEALTSKLGVFSSESKDAAGSARALGEANSQAKEEVKNARAELIKNISETKNFKGTKEEEKSIVEKLNNTYGETMGYFSTVHEWYNALVKDSKAYCDQLIIEAENRKLADQAADIDDKIHNIRYDKNGKLKKYSTQDKKEAVYGTGSFGQTTVRYVTKEGTSDLDKANADIRSLTSQRNAIRNRMESNNRSLQGISMPVRGSGTRPGGNTPPPKTNTRNTPKTGGGNTETKVFKQDAQTTAEISDNISILQEKLSHTKPDTDAYRKISDEIATWQERLDKINQGYEDGSVADYGHQISKLDEAMRNLNLTDEERNMLLAERASLQQKADAIGDKAAPAGSITSLNRQIQRKQVDYDNATTDEARAKIQVDISDIQRQIDEKTNGKLTIPAEVEPVRIEKGSKEDKRQSYQNAQAQSGEIQQMFDLKIIGADEAQSSLDKINAKLKELHVDPIKLDFRTKGEKEAAEAVKSLQDSLGGDFSNTITQWQNIGKAFTEGGDAATGAGSAIAAVGSSMQQMAGDGAAAKVGAIMAAIGQLVLGYATASAQASSMGPWGWIGFAVAGAATLASIIAQVSSFSTGGIVGGTSYHGDKVPARVNSGEMVLTMKQQKRLFDIANGLALPRMPIVSPDTSAVDNMVAMPALSITMKDKLEGTTVRKQIRNVEWIYSKVGKEWKA